MRTVNSPHQNSSPFGWERTWASGDVLCFTTFSMATAPFAGDTRLNQERGGQHAATLSPYCSHSFLPQGSLRTQWWTKEVLALENQAASFGNLRRLTDGLRLKTRGEPTKHPQRIHLICNRSFENLKASANNQLFIDRSDSLFTPISAIILFKL